MSRASAFLLSGLLVLVGVSAKAAEPFNWNGPYVGVNAGYYWVHQDWFDVDSWFNGQTITTRPDGGAVGGTVGYNYVLNGLLLGLEADLDWLSVTAQNRVNNLTYRVGTTSTSTSTSTSTDFYGNTTTTTTTSTTSNPPATTSVKLKSDWPWAGSLRARAGVPFDRGLVYLTAGVALAEWTDKWTDTSACPTGWTCSYSKSGVTPGGLFGGGVEYALTDHLLVGTSINWVEYQTRTSPALYYYSQAIPYRYKMPADSFYLRLSVNYKLW